ncbi:MAG: DNA-binding response regulator, partial [Chloroflexi bacterium]
LARAGLAMLLANHPDCHVTGQLSGVDFLMDVQEDNEYAKHVDIIIWDLGWDFEGAPPKWHEVDKPIVALIPDEGETAVSMLPGIAAILRRNSSHDHIITAAQAASLGLITIDPTIAHFPSNISPESDFTPVEELMPRELQVIQLVAEGMTNKAIAQQLNISSHTVKFHVNAIMNKLAAQSRTEAVVRATRIGLISL